MDHIFRRLLPSMTTGLQQLAALAGCLMAGVAAVLLEGRDALPLAWPLVSTALLVGLLLGPRSVFAAWLAAALPLPWLAQDSHHLLIGLIQTLIPAGAALLSGKLVQWRLLQHSPAATALDLQPRSSRGPADDRLIETLPGAVLVSSDGYCRYASHAALRLLGGSLGDLLGQPLASRAKADSLSALQRHLQQRRLEDPPPPRAPLHLQPDIWLQIDSLPCHYQGRPAMLLLLEPLEQRTDEALDSPLFQLSRDLLALLDEQGHLLRINPALAALIEHPTRPVLGQKLASLLHPEDRSAFEHALSQTPVGVAPQPLLLRLRSHAQQWLWVDWQLCPHGDGWLLSGTDTTAKRRDQQQLRLDAAPPPSAAALHEAQIDHAIHSLLDRLREGVLLLDEQGRIEHSNPAVQHILGHTPTELTGLALPQLFEQPDREHLEDALSRHRAGEDHHLLGQRRELAGRHRSGRPVRLELSLCEYPVRGRAQLIATLRDISERQALIDSLTAARHEAEQASEAKSSFLATMSHEIRTPMNGVLGMLEVLAHTPLDSQQEEMLGIIRDSATLLLGIINDILDFSKIEADRLELEQVELSSASLIEQVCALLDRQALQNGIELTLFTDPQIPEPLLGDPLRLRQVLVNLLGNALKFSRSTQGTGRVEVRSRLLSRDGGQVHLEIAVRDNGIGISAEAQQHLFQAFTQADSSTTRRFGGTGLGLAICHKLVTLMGGRIEVDSQPGEGSTFRVLLALPVAAHLTPRPLPCLDGISALLVGTPQGLLTDLASYLEEEGVWLTHLPDLDSPLTERHARHAQFCLIDSGHHAPDPAMLDTAARTWQLPQLQFVCIGRGELRRARRESPNLVRLDANLLRRNSFIEAIELALGRRQEGAQPTAARLQHSAPSRAEARACGRLILLAEDNAINQKVLLRQLGLLGMTADVADDGVQALQRWRSGDYALLLSDLQMPNMDGLQLARAIRSAEAPGEHLPIIALTANTQQGAVQECLAAGMDDYLSKPVPLEELRAQLERWLPSPAADTSSGAEHVSFNTPAGAAMPAMTSSPALAVLDLDVLRAMVGDEDEVLDEFLGDFQRAATDMLAQLQQKLDAGDAAAIASITHRLKSNARSVGALAMGELCAQLEQAGNQRQDQQTLTALLDALRRAWEAVAADIDQRLG